MPGQPRRGLINGFPLLIWYCAMAEQPVAGGSAAGQAYRAELERQGKPVGLAVTDVLAGNPQNPPHRSALKEARSVERKLVSGRARVIRNAAQPLVGKTVDISETGACILMDDMLPSKTACVLEFDIFHNGKRYVFSTTAQVVYGIFSSGRGFKVGFQFGPRSPEASSSIAALVA